VGVPFTDADTTREHVSAVRAWLAVASKPVPVALLMLMETPVDSFIPVVRPPRVPE
jgi:hypothetical protein